FQPGEYLAELELPFLSPLVRLVDRLNAIGRRLIRETRGPHHPDASSAASFNVFRIPFVDYARGDGRAIGPTGSRPWAEVVLLDEHQSWAMEYRGLWGLFARDPIAGENAPAGPVYNRDGRMRRSWYDPLGWAGLDKVPPPGEAPRRIQQQLADLEGRRATLAETIEAKSRQLTGLGIEAQAMQGRSHLAKEYAAHRTKIAALSQELDQLRGSLASDSALAESLRLHADDLLAGQRGPARGHIHRANHPAHPSDLRFNRAAELWAAISIGLVMVGFVALVLLGRSYLLFGLITLLSVLIFIEAGFRRQLARLVDSLTVALSIVAALVLLFTFFWEAAIVVVMVTGAYIMWENLHELRR
ncbi:MAG: hypothetical protein ABI847_09730, partial [Anaerolineales bacterium]